MTLLLAISLATARNPIYYFISTAKFQEAFEGVLNGITKRNFSAFVFALIKVDCTVSDMITNYLFMRLKTKQNTTNFHVAITLKFTS